MTFIRTAQLPVESLHELLGLVGEEENTTHAFCIQYILHTIHNAITIKDLNRTS